VKPTNVAGRGQQRRPLAWKVIAAILVIAALILTAIAFLPR
jgi:hypothetical protein